jgi:hypothetical protein
MITLMGSVSCCCLIRCCMVVVFGMVVMFALALASTGSLPSSILIVQPYPNSLTPSYPSSSCQVCTGVMCVYGWSAHR